MDYWIYVLFPNSGIVIDGEWKYVIKIGSTLYPENRKWAYATYGPNPPVYLHLFKFSSNSFENNPQNLYDLDNKKFPEYLIKSGLKLNHITNGGGTEWYIKEWDYLNTLKNFFKEHNLTVLEQIDNDPFPLKSPSESERKKMKEEDTEIIIRKSMFSLKNKFFSTFLPNGSIPRRIQSELWDLMEIICNSPDPLNYKGIVQWPTGVGKSIAILILVVLEAERCKRLGLIYRGLLITHKNDIFKTIKDNFSKLSIFGIDIYDGTNGKLSSLSIPSDKHILVMACHSAFMNKTIIDGMPPMLHIHYDEVHRITGEEFFQIIKQKIEDWKTELLTGTSATPKTSSPSQHKKFAELFGDPFTILHKCDVYEAVGEGWIAKPRFILRILSKQDPELVLIASVDCFVELVIQKGKGKKNILYIETSISDVMIALTYAKTKYPDINFYSAIDIERTDNEFIKAPVTSKAEILFACQRYREGSDIKGIEITGKLIGNTTSAYILLQICGRALRIEEDPNKEGWCIIIRPSEDGTSEEEVLDSIVLEIAEFLGNSDKPLGKKEIVNLVTSYFGDVIISGNKCSLEETIQRIQAAYLRNQYAKRTPKEKYHLIRAFNKELNICSKEEYHVFASKHPKYIEDPKSYFKDYWISWYDFLGVDTTAFPQTKQEWIHVCRDLGILSWDEYKAKKNSTLPVNPGEMYEDYTNWDKEFGVEEEIVW